MGMPMKVTEKQIKALRDEAREHGDDLMVIITTHALCGYDEDILREHDFTGHDRREWRRLGLEGMSREDARAECERVIAAAAGEDEGDPVDRALRDAPEDDEPVTADEEALVDVARDEAARGETVPHDEVTIKPMNMQESREWAHTAEVGDRLCTYEAAYADADDATRDGSRCGFGDDELDALNRILAKRGLRLVADDIGLTVARRGE